MWAQRLEWWALIGLAFVLPLLEAPKNLLWLAYVLLWLWNRARAQDFGGPWERWDSLIAAWIVSGYLSAAFGAMAPGTWSNVNDLLRYGSVLWLMKRSRYPDQLFLSVSNALITGTVVTLGFGYYNLLWADKPKVYLELNSVGFVNHSAIYLAIVAGMALVHTRAYWREMRPAFRIPAFALLAGLAVSLIVMRSRAAVGGAFVVALVLLGIHAWKTHRGMRTLWLGAALAVGLLLAARPDVVVKIEDRLDENRMLAGRDAIWRAGLEAFRTYPLFGVGIESYGKFGAAEFDRLRTSRKGQDDRSRYLFSSHGHSLYVNALAERGLVGFAALLAILLAWGFALVRHIPGAQAPPLLWTWWGGAASAWLITVTVGTVNTTLHHEHALVSMILLGGWLSLARAHRPPS
jgi:O-antigen ligase